MIRKETDISPLARKLLALAIGVMFLLGVLQIAQGFIDTKNYREQIRQVIKERTGKDILIKGKVTASLYPTPSLYVPGIELRGLDDKDPAPTLTIDLVHIKPDILSLFSDKLKVSSILLENPSLEVRRAEDGTIHWEWLNRELFKIIIGGDANSAAVSVEISQGKILYRNDFSDDNFTLRNINLTGKTGAHPSGKGTIDIAGRAVQFDLNTQGNAPAGALPFNMTVNTDVNDTVQLQNGSIDYTGEQIKILGEFNANVADLMVWVNPKNVDSAKPEDALPVKLTGKWTQADWQVDLAEVSFDGMESKGAGKLNFTWVDEPAIATDISFSELKYTRWQALILALADRMQGGAASKLYRENNEEQQESTLPKNIKLVVNARADTLSVSDQQWQNATLSATMQDGAITVNQFNIALPDAATLTLFGIISQSGTKSLRFEGSFESQGKSLRNLLTIFDASAAELPAAAFSDFYIHSNIFVSPEQVRMSEADVKISELKLNGGMVGYFDSKPRIEADVKLKDINFDYFRDLWRNEQKEKPANSKDFFLQFNKGMNFSWLKKLKTNIDFKVMVDGFTFLERKGTQAAFRLFAEEGKFGIYNTRFYFPGNTIEASFNLDVMGDAPYITVLFNTASEINANYFSPVAEKPPEPAPAEPIAAPAGDAAKEVTIIPQTETTLVDMPDDANPSPAAEAPKEKTMPASEESKLASGKDRWSKELFDMRWMEGYNGSFDISLGKLIVGDKTFNRLKMKSQLVDRELIIQALSFGYWQGRCDVTGKLYGGKVPGLSVGFTLSNTDLSDVVHSFSERNNITGRLGVSGTLSTSGVNMLSWVSQADAKLVLNGVGVRVENFNLQGVVDTVAVSRTTADVVTNVNLVLPKGNTEFSLEGYLNVKNGTVKTPGITLKTGNITGNLTGTLKLVPWTMDLSTMYQFPAMTSETVPTLAVQIAGPVDDPQMQTDTDSLEAYVSKRIVNR